MSATRRSNVKNYYVLRSCRRESRKLLLLPLLVRGFPVSLYDHRCLVFQNEQKTAAAEEEIARLKARVRLLLCTEVVATWYSH